MRDIRILAASHEIDQHLETLLEGILHCPYTAKELEQLARQIGQYGGSAPILKDLRGGPFVSVYPGELAGILWAASRAVRYTEELHRRSAL